MSAQRVRDALVVVVLVLAGGVYWTYLRGWNHGVVGGGGFGVAMPSVPAGIPYTLGAGTLCVRGIDSAVIDAVVPDDDSGLQVVAFGVQDAALPPGGAQTGTLADAGFVPGGLVTTPREATRSTDLAVQITKPTDATARTSGLQVRWHDGGRSGTALVDVRLALCAGGPAGDSTSDC